MKKHKSPPILRIREPMEVAYNRELRRQSIHYGVVVVNPGTPSRYKVFLGFRTKTPRSRFFVIREVVLS